MDAFEKDKYYVMTPPGRNWSDYEGPFDTNQRAFEHLKELVDPDYYTPESQWITLVFFDGKQVDLVKHDGVVVNGQMVIWDREFSFQ